MSSNFERIRPVVALVGRVVLGAIMLAHGWGKVAPRGSLYNFARSSEAADSYLSSKN